MVCYMGSSVVAHSNVKRKDRYSTITETAGVSFLEIQEPLSRIDTQSRTAGLQFSNLPLPQRRIPGWLPALALAAAVLAVGNALGHMLVAMAILAIVTLVAWGNWVLDNTAM